MATPFDVGNGQGLSPNHLVSPAFLRREITSSISNATFSPKRAWYGQSAAAYHNELAICCKTCLSTQPKRQRQPRSLARDSYETAKLGRASASPTYLFDSRS